MKYPRTFLNAHRQTGFTLVEMVIALLFTSLLMAGMARVYQGSLGTFTTTAERISAGRKGRIALDSLSDDLNAAGLLVDFLTPTNVLMQPSNPGFYVIPNRPVTFSDGAAASDELYFYYDQFLPFEGRVIALNSGAGSSTQSGQILSNTSQTALDMTIKVSDPTFASLVTTNSKIVLGNQYRIYTLASTATSGDTIRVVTSMSEAGNMYGAHGEANQVAGGSVTEVAPMAGNGDFNDNSYPGGGTAVFFYLPSQMVRYSVQARSLDPSDAAHTSPVLMREQGTYSPGGFVASSPAQIIAEDVLQMQIYLSADGGKNWARTGVTATDYAGGWLSGIVPQINAQLSAHGLPGHQDANDVSWFQANPMLIRVDLVTRTTTKRTENTTVANTAGYNTQTRSLIMVPRHFGLQLN